MVKNNSNLILVGEKYISKEQALMQLTGKFPKDMSLDKYIGLVTCRINELSTTDVIPIPDQTTNGDMFMTMFPSTKIRWMSQSHLGVTFRDNQDYIIQFELEWWNSPFKKEVEE